MFLNWFRDAFRTAPAHPDRAFVNRVTIKRPVHPLDPFVFWGWALILTKCILASVAIWYWEIPIADFYVWGPSLIFGGLCTTLYLTREDE